MKSLRPATVATMGPLLMGCAFALAAYLASPRGGTDAMFSLLIGTGFGLLIFGPIAGARTIRERHPVWLDRYSVRVQWYASLAMSLAMGYLLACLRNNKFDAMSVVAVTTVFLGAVVKVALGAALNGRSAS